MLLRSTVTMFCFSLSIVNDSTKTDGLLHNKTEEGLENETS